MIFPFKLYKIRCYLGHAAKKMQAYDHKRHHWKGNLKRCR